MYGRLIRIDPQSCLIWGNGRIRRVPYEAMQAREGEFVVVRNGTVQRIARGELRGRGEMTRLIQGRSNCLRLREQVLRSIRDFFYERDFLEVTTPNLAASGGLDTHIDQFSCIEQGLSLITSPEFYMKRLIAGGEERIFQIGPAFRRESPGTMHNPEFTILEFYRAHTDYNGIMDDLEAMIKSIYHGVNSESSDQEGSQGTWPRVSVAELLAKAGVSMDATTDVINRAIADWDGELGMEQPVFVKDYPASMASLAALDPETGLAQRFELYIEGVELANGFTELRDPDEQLDRFIAVLKERRALGLDLPAVDTRFIAALAEGLPLVAGVAVGVDRLVGLVAGEAGIGPCLAFPWKDI